MSSEREAAGMRVALMSYDERELRVRKFYLEEQSPTISRSKARRSRALVSKAGNRCWKRCGKRGASMCWY